MSRRGRSEQGRRSIAVWAVGLASVGLGLPQSAAGAPDPQRTQSRPAGTAQPRPAGEGETRPARPAPEVEFVIDGDPVLKLIPKDTIEPIDDPRMVPAAEADAFMREDEMVLGVYDGRQARAWSTWHLDRHEVVNDRLGETPIAATW